LLSPLRSPNGLGILLVSLGLVGLFFIETLVSKRSSHFELSISDSEVLKKIPIDTSLEVVRSGGVSLPPQSKKTSFEVLGASKQSQSKLMLVNFWATWCDPCIEELPSLKLLSKQLNDGSTSSLPLFVTVSVDEKKEAIFNLEKSLQSQFDFIILHDPDGQFSRSLRITKFPETLLINSEGTILHKWIGPQDWQSQEIIQTLASFAKP